MMSLSGGVAFLFLFASQGPVGGGYDGIEIQE
jgi:hypothetical protein